MRLTVDIERGDFVGEEEIEPLLAALSDVAGSHVGHLCPNITVAVGEVAE